MAVAGLSVLMHPRLAALPVREAIGVRVPAATTLRARLLGLALLERADAGAGLLIPCCHSIHTFGMRFAIDVVFLNADGRELGRERSVRPGRLSSRRGAAAVLELPR